MIYPDFICLFIRQFSRSLMTDYPSWDGENGQYRTVFTQSPTLLSASEVIIIYTFLLNFDRWGERNVLGERVLICTP